MGNIMQKDLFDIWTGKIKTKYRERFIKRWKKINTMQKLLCRRHIIIG